MPLVEANSEDIEKSLARTEFVPYSYTLIHAIVMQQGISEVKAHRIPRDALIRGSSAITEDDTTVSQREGGFEITSSLEIGHEFWIPLE